ncbi:NAD(P)-binding protein [Inquilinus sp. Marseille-Q2685]|uniref:NAD(P)-binding protein n=1 Tax=Inquilinus sp. Marseille-Q2685 TaxID=2866581 RepID=UPI001CE3CD11|nr:NAD(P)-binding protein [Inquilinus sp. Marseille-Q2685]
MTSISSSIPRPDAAAMSAMHATGSTADLPIAIIGGGPVGLAAAAQCLARGLEPVILEAGDRVGAAVRAWGHVPMFSEWEFNLDRAAVGLLEKAGWDRPDDRVYPTGRELAERYLDPLSATPEISARLRLNSRVIGMARSQLGKLRTEGREVQPFEVRYGDASGREHRLFARAVIDASGTWSNPSPGGANGLPAIGERSAADRVRYGMPDVLGAERDRYVGKRVLVVGSGHSAIGTLIDLAALAELSPGTRILWAIRGTDMVRIYGGGSADQLPRRGALGRRVRALVDQGAIEILTPFALDEITRGAGGTLVVAGISDGGTRSVEVDEMIVATGLRPDLSFLGELRLDLDPALECSRALAPLIDPNVHSCGTVRPHGAAELAQPEPGLYLIGMKSYGRAPTFLLATGYEQARSVVAKLAGDEEGARRIELVLPETGVCSGSGARPGTAPAETEAECCGPKITTEPRATSCCGAVA